MSVRSFCRSVATGFTAGVRDIASQWHLWVGLGLCMSISGVVDIMGWGKSWGLVGLVYFTVRIALADDRSARS